ncbi:hypothetical protein OAX78_00065 [Planctomycetota bacterium]|nr:hypothetical protein [Planctomycetota bacterium]
MSEAVRSKVQLHRDRCPFCHEEVGPADDKLACDGCMAWHHFECWNTHGSCSACGRDRTARTDAVAPAAPRCESRQGCTEPSDPSVTVNSWLPLCTRHAHEAARAQRDGFRLTTILFTLVIAGMAIGVLVSGQPGALAILPFGAIPVLCGFGWWHWHRRYAGWPSLPPDSTRVEPPVDPKSLL